MHAVGAMADYCRDRGAPFAVFLYEHVPTAKTSAMGEDLTALTHAHAVPFASTAPWLAGEPPLAVVNSLVDPHPNAKGHALIAAGMLEFLQTQHVLPQ
jgi:hypothetical protein